MKFEQQESPLEKTIKFYKTIEAGDIALFDYFQEAIFFLGRTKVGKTASCHCLCGSPLRAEQIPKSKTLVYRPSTNKYSAKVGNVADSETEIPNIFKTEILDPQTKQVKRTVVLDQPGYGDTYGFHRTFSNGYFHYRSFSKTGKIKFVLVFSNQNLQEDASNFKSTIINFINSFKNYQSIKDKIQGATSFLITKLDKVPDMSDRLMEKLIFLRDNAVKNMGKQKANIFSLIDHIIKNKKFYCIPKPTQVGVSTTENKILQQIYFNSSFFERPVDQKNSNFVSMQQINFSVAKQVVTKLNDDNLQVYQKDFTCFMDFTQKRLTNIISTHKGSLVNIMKRLTEDSQISNQSNLFLNLMQQLNQQYYQFSPQYNTQRKKRELDLFKQEQNQSSTSIKHNESINTKKIKYNQNTYFIKKFQVLQYVKSLVSNNQQRIGFVERTIKEMEEVSTTFKKIFRKFTILGITKEHQEIILRYSYIIQRLIEEYKIIILILFRDNQALVNSTQPDKLCFNEDLYRSITDRFFTQTIGEINVPELKMSFIKRFNFNELIVINDEIIQFFQDLTSQQNILKNNDQFLGERDYSQSENSNDKLILFRVSELLQKYYNQIFAVQTPPTQQQKLKILKKLYQYRNKFYRKLNFQIEIQSKKQFITHIFTITKLLAIIFKNLEKLELARDCYISINDAKSVFLTYQEEINLQVDKKSQISPLLNYAKAAISYDRKDLAKDCYQRVYSLSDDSNKIMEISRLIVRLSHEEEEECQYIQNLTAGKVCLDLSNRIKSWLQNQ